MAVSAQHDATASSDDARYLLLRRIGAGGMAEVFLARQRLGAAGVGVGDRTVVIKRMLPHLAEDAKFERLFVREARLASQLQHPNIVQIHDVAMLAGRAAIVMEHLRGVDTRAAFRYGMQRARGIDPATATAIAEQAALGLDHAHHATDEGGQPLSIVHRDISPHNVFLTRQGVVKILDFGVARSRLEETATGSVKGKLAYMAPEQAFRRPLDQRTDLFALGVVLWELLTGKRLFRGASPAETLQALLHGPIRPPSSVADVPPELDAIVLRALAREPTQRWARGRELAEALARVRRDLSEVPGVELVASLVERISPEENTPTTPADPDSDIGDDHPQLTLDVAVGASTRVQQGASDDPDGEDSDDEEELADPPPAAVEVADVRGRPTRWPWLGLGVASIAALGAGVWLAVAGGGQAPSEASREPAAHEQNVNPSEPTANPSEPTANPSEPTANPSEPMANPSEPTANPSGARRAPTSRSPGSAVTEPLMDASEPTADAGAPPRGRGARRDPPTKRGVGSGIIRDYP